MLSIIICNYNPKRIEPLEKNIGSKIGLDFFELIVIDNSSNSKSIFEAYNEGACIAKFEKLLFLHDDVEFLTQDFGKILLEMNLPHLGVLGIAGSILKTKTPSPWWISNYHSLPKGILYQYNIQHYGNSQPQKVELGFEGEGKIKEVLFVDGVFMYTTKNNWKEYPFDSTTFNSFHFYDLDYSLGMHEIGKTNYVSNKILLQHFSSGSLNNEWVKSSKSFANKWPKTIHIGNLKQKDLEMFEKWAIESRINILFENNLIIDAINLMIREFHFQKKSIKKLVKSIFY